jgi:hypothetical protein
MGKRGGKIKMHFPTQKSEGKKPGAVPDEICRGSGRRVPSLDR